MPHFTKISLIYYACYSIIDIAGLMLTEVSIPKYIDIRKEVAQLSCKFELGSGKLYSVKWYKDDHEFFRYMPDSRPASQNFPVDGVQLDVGRSNITTITFVQLSFNSSGKYRCEVSKEAPTFQTVGKTQDMNVIALPAEPLFISVPQSKYSIGDSLLGNCTLPPSHPLPNLTWYINSKKAEDKYLQHYKAVPSPVNRLLHSSSLGIRFQITKDHFTNGSLSLRCTAKMVNSQHYEKLINIHLDNPTKDGIHAQNRLNNSSSQQQAERLNALMATISLYCLYYVYQ